MPEIESGAPRLTDEINHLIDKFDSINLSAAPEVEPALVAPLLASGDFVNFSGPPGCGKTRLAVDIALAAIADHRDGIALGGLLQFDLDRFGGRNIAIIDAENNIHRWASLFRQKMTREGVEAPDLVERAIYIDPQKVGLQNQINWTPASLAVAEALAVCRVGLVIGDTLGRIWAPEDINATGWVQRGFATFRAACKRYGITGVMLTHTPKKQGNRDEAAKGPIGTSFQEGQADAQVMVHQTNVDGSRGIELTLRKARRPFWIQQGSKVRLQFTNDLGYRPVGGWQTEWAHKCPNYYSEAPLCESSTRDKVAQHMRDHANSGVRSRDIADELGVGDRAVRHHLSDLEAKDLVKKINGGSRTAWRWSG